MMSPAAALAFVILSLGSHTQTAQRSGMQAESMQDAGMHHAEKPAAVVSTTLLVRSPTQAVTLSLADLQALPQTTVKVHNGHTNADETYTGPLLSEVLAKAGLVVTPKSEHDFLRMSIVASGTDNYFVVYSGAEVEPALHKAEVIIALALEGKPLTRTGAFQLIDSLDVKPARWVRNLNKLHVISSPEVP